MVLPDYPLVCRAHFRRRALLPEHGAGVFGGAGRGPGGDLLKPGEVHVWRAPRGVAPGEILARYLGRIPERFEKGSHGKPRLAGADDWLRFNLSHSGDVTLIAVARDSEVGVDVERIRPVVEMRAIARRWLGRDDIADEREFLRAWTLHEAMLKALGVGLSGTTESFAGFVAEIDAGPGYAAALAVLAADCRVMVRDWPPIPGTGYVTSELSP